MNFQSKTTQNIFNLVSTCYCANFSHQILQQTDTGIVVTFTQPGFESFVNENIMNYIQQYIYGGTFPNILFSISQFDVQFKDITIKQITMPPFQFNMQSNGATNMQLDNAGLELELKFSIQQQLYPFISDKGTGKIVITNTDLNAQLIPIMLENCSYHIGAKALSSRFVVGQLNIQLESQYQFLYESILRFANDMIKDLFNDQFGTIFTDIIMAGLNYGESETDDASVGHGNNNTFLTDQRWIQIDMHLGYMQVYSPGQTCFGDDRGSCQGWVDVNNTQIPVDFKTNLTNQYLLNKVIFDSQLQQIFDHQLLITDEPCSIVKIVHTGVVLKCQINGSAYQELLSLNVYIGEVNGASSVTFFKLSVLQQVFPSTQSIEGNSFIDQLNNALDQTSPNYDNKNMLYMTYCDVIYLSEQWIHTSCHLK